MYDLVRPLAPIDHGWFGNGRQIEEIFRSRPISTVVEVGSWLGRSTIFMANLIKSGGKVYAVDHWRGSAEHQLGAKAHHYALHCLYHHFLSNVMHAGMTDVIVPVRMESAEAAFALNVEPDLIYIDGSHDYDSVLCDLNSWSSRAEAGAILCGDDWWHSDVERAVTDFAEEKGLEVLSEENFWRLVEQE